MAERKPPRIRVRWDEYNLIKWVRDNGINPLSLQTGDKQSSTKDTEESKEKNTWDEKSDNALWEYKGDANITTLQEALDFSEVDLDEWEVERHTFNTWTTTYKDKDKEAKQKWNIQIKIWFKRKTSIKEARIEDAINALYDRVANLSSPKIKPANTSSTGKLLEIDIFDPHFGKYALKEETDDPYDIFIAKERYQESISTLINRAKHHKIEKILYPIGNDWFHFDTWNATTTKGTPQDTHMKWWEMYVHGSEIAFDNINMLAQIAPVDVVVIPGNHGWENTVKLGYTLSKYYDDNKYVNVEANPKGRKYYRYGNVGIGFTHGNEEKHTDLPNIMLREKQKEWGDVKFMEWHLGHFHKQKRIDFKAVDELNGIMLRFLRSLSSTDFWHYKRGYVGGLKGCEAFIWDKKEGLYDNYPVTL